MADYYASARSNYFRVKDKDAFVNHIQKMVPDVTVDKEETDGKDYYVLLFEEGIPTWCYDDKYNDVEIDWRAFFAKHLEEDSIAVLMEAGAEKLRYIAGLAFAYNAKGEELVVSLLDIYGLITSTWGTDLEATPTEY